MIEMKIIVSKMKVGVERRYFQKVFQNLINSNLVFKIFLYA